MMVVLIVESAPPNLRGELTKWMLEPKAGVYVGTVSAAVRDLLWKKACAQVRRGGCTMIYSAANEQGFAMRTFGDTTRKVVNREGLYLVQRFHSADDRVLEQAEPVMRLWAKVDPFQPLPCHLVDVGNVAVAILDTPFFRKVRQMLSESMEIPEAEINAWIGYIAALHDWGKGWRNFQGRPVEGVPAALHQAGLNLRIVDEEKAFRHEFISRKWIEEHLREHWEWRRRDARTIGAAVGGHHGRWERPLIRLSNFDGIDKWYELKKETELLVREAFLPLNLKPKIQNHSVVAMLLVGVITWADWIASNVELFPLRWSGESWSEYCDLSRTAADRAIGKLGLNREGKEPSTHFNSFSEAWPQFKEPRPIQRVAEQIVNSDSKPGLTIIEAPMGDGKTEAALYIASQCNRDGGGLYVALPTAATSNQMFERVSEFIEHIDPQAASSVQLVHGTSWLVDKIVPDNIFELSEGYDPEVAREAYSWFLPRKRSLLATYGVGTVDQVLMAVLNVKHGFLRLFGLAGKTLIVDEVHAYDAYMTEMLTLLLQWCRELRISVILLSATLPKKQKDELIRAYLHENTADGNQVEIGIGVGNLTTDKNDPYPLITTVEPDTEKIREISVPQSEEAQEIRIEKHEGLLDDPASIADLAVETLGNSGCVCVIVNTISSAQAIYTSLRQRYPQIDSLLFHGRFLVKDRQTIEKRALEWFDKRSLLPSDHPDRLVRPQKAILIATQVVEQSLDLDFDAMITEIAPMDLLLQRSGRLHRHERKERPSHLYPPTLHVLLPSSGTDDFGASSYVYEPYVLLRTRMALGEKWRLPDDIRFLIESVYSDEVPDEISDALRAKLQKTYEQKDENDQKRAREAEKYLIPQPDARIFQMDFLNSIAFDEQDSGVKSYFTAKTRYGDQTCQVLCIDIEKWLRIEQLKRVPGKELRKDLMLHTVAIPRWWLNNVKPADDYVAISEAPRWLSSVEFVIPTVNDQWFGRNEEGDAIAIEIQRDLGITYTVVEG